MGAGIANYQQNTNLVIQCSIHGDAHSSTDNAQVISTMFRSQYATDWFESNYPVAVPLYADDPKQVPFINDQQQFEYRWIVDANLQINPVISVPQEFADAVSVTINEVK